MRMSEIEKAGKRKGIEIRKIQFTEQGYRVKFTRNGETKTIFFSDFKKFENWFSSNGVK